MQLQRTHFMSVMYRAANWHQFAQPFPDGQNTRVFGFQVDERTVCFLQFPVREVGVPWRRNSRPSQVTRPFKRTNSVRKKKMENLPVHTRDAIKSALRLDQKIEAVKLYREATGCDLKTAKRLIEDVMFNVNATRQFPPDFKGIDEGEVELILDEIFAGRKLDAVKRYKAASGCGLKASKEFVEDLTEKLKRDSPDQFQTVSSSSGCASVLLVSLVFGMAITSLATCLIISVLSNN